MSDVRGSWVTPKNGGVPKPAPANSEHPPPVKNLSYDYTEYKGVPDIFLELMGRDPKDWVPPLPLVIFVDAPEKDPVDEVDDISTGEVPSP